jgi:predicted nucleic acid-binding Zn ribbon protein
LRQVRTATGPDLHRLRAQRRVEFVADVDAHQPQQPEPGQQHQHGHRDRAGQREARRQSHGRTSLRELRPCRCRSASKPAPLSRNMTSLRSVM